MDTIGIDLSAKSVKVIWGSSHLRSDCAQRLELDSKVTTIKNFDWGEKAPHWLSVFGVDWLDRNANDDSILTFDQNYRSEYRKAYFQSREFISFYRAILIRTAVKDVDKVVIGMPLGFLQDKEYVGDLKKKLSGKFSLTSGKTVNIDAVELVHQPAGAYLSFSRRTASDWEQFELLKKSNALLVDVGLYSSEWLSVKSGSKNEKWSGSSPFALEYFYHTIKNFAEIELKSNVSMDVITSKICGSKDTFEHFGVMIEPVKLNIVAQYRTFIQLAKEIRKTQCQQADPDIILISGQGARFCKSVIEDVYPNSKLIEANNASDFSCAEGFFVYL